VFITIELVPDARIISFRSKTYPTADNDILVAVTWALALSFDLKPLADNNRINNFDQSSILTASGRWMMNTLL
jgi:hypothetical protein